MPLTDSSPSQTARIAGFDGLRAVGFLLVFVSHKFASPTTEMYGSLGVWLFFVLSGFLITRILHDLRAAIDRGETTFRAALWNIYVRRCVRIFPVYYTVVLALVAASRFVDIAHLSPPELFAYLSHTVNFYVAEHGWIGHFGHFWSLSIEVQYYALFSILGLMLSADRIWLSCCAFIAWGTLVNIMSVRAASDTIALDVNSALGFALFGLGGIAGLVAGRREASWLTRPTVLILAFLAFLAVPMAFASYPQFASFGRPGTVLAAIVLVGIYRHQHSIVVRALDWRPLRRLGTISYAAYIIHNFLSFTRVEQWVATALGTPFLAKVARAGAEFAATIAICSLSWRLIERPSIAWARRMTHRQSAL